MPGPAGASGPSSESRDWSQAAALGVAEAGASIVPDPTAVMTSATTCLQLNETGQLHSPMPNLAGCPGGRVKNAAVR